MEGNRVFDQLQLMPLWACPPLHIIIFKSEIIFRNVPELWEGAISKAPEIIINHLNETLIRSCVHYSTQKDQGPPRFLPDDILNDGDTIALAILFSLSG